MPKADAMTCAECGMVVKPANAYHPWLYCELWKLGHADPEAYLRTYGFERRAAMSTNAESRSDAEEGRT